MEWIISAIGLAVLLLLAWGTQRPPAPSYRDAALEGELNKHLSALSARPADRRKAALRLPAGLMKQLEGSIGYLNRLPEEELLPAARWLSDNGRFLQEETAALKLALPHKKRLPAAGEGEPRIFCFARELMGHTNAELRMDRLGQSLVAWQEAAPFSEQELNLLPLALRTALLSIVQEMAELCAAEQYARAQAQRLARLTERGQSKAALRLFDKYKHSAAFLEQLLCQLRQKEKGENDLWLERYFTRQDLSAEKLASGEHEHQTENCLWVSNAITSLRLAGRTPWHRLLEEWSNVHEALLADEIYPQMDRESRAFYRTRTTELGRLTGKPELSVLAAAFTLCGSAKEGECQAHVGYYLLDRGEEQLIAYLHPVGAWQRMRIHLLWHGPGLYRLGSWLSFGLLCVLAARFGLFPVFWPMFGVVFTCTVQQLAQWLCRRFLPPRRIPRIKVEHLTEKTRTLVVCPTMLLSGEHALAMVKHLSVLHSANPDPNLHFLLLGDYRDSLTGTLSGDEEIVSTASAAIRALREDTGHPFFYFQRERVYHGTDHLYMSRERKRGSLETLLRLICGLPVEDTFAYCSVPPEGFKDQYRYVITLDSDTFLPPGSALRMIGAMLHPLQQWRREKDGMRGVSILQPRMEVAAHKVESRLALLLGGQGGTDPYNALAAEFDHDLCRSGSFVGKGIIDPQGFLQATEGKIVPGTVLSHDLLEGQLAGCAYASDITLYDGHPKTLKGFLYRLHRWTRGDWQLLCYLLPVFPVRPPRQALDSISRHKLWMNLLRSLAAPLRWLLLCYVTATGHWVLALCTLLLPEMPSLLPMTRSGLAEAFARIAVLPLYAMLQLDAIGRTLYRLAVSRRHLLQWTTAAQLSRPSDKPPMLFFYLSIGSAAAAAGLGFLPGGSRSVGVALAVWWLAFPFLLPFWEQGLQREYHPTEFVREVLHRLAGETLLFFETAITGEDHGLPPDNVQIDPNKGISHRTSPTNIGLYLTALLSAQKLGLLTTEELTARMALTVDTVEQLPKWKGHLYNWYDTRSLAPLPPLFVSSVDNGNLVVCLLTCAQGLRVLLPELSGEGRLLSGRMDRLAHEMNFRPLFDYDAELFFIGRHPELPGETPVHYDLLASEARLLSFAAIMLGQVPVKHWYRLGRSRAHTRYGQTLLSFSGTMFEYMMPLLFQPLVRGTLLETACTNALREQAAHRLGGAFGVSESGYYAFDPNLYYQYRAFGLPALALDGSKGSDVLSPYSSVLAMAVDPKRGFASLLKLQSMGLEGPMGFFEAADFNNARVGRKQPFQIVRSHMAHHQGMILTSICNTLTGNYIADLFAGLPRAQAYRLLLEERPLKLQGVIRHPLKRAGQESAPSPLEARRAGRPLAFPIDAHVLHGAGTTLLVDAQGGGYMARDGKMLTRFREDCSLPSGMRLYLRDSQSGVYWGMTDPHVSGAVSFETAQTVFEHERLHVQTRLRIFVNPLDGAVLHHVELENLTNTERMMEVCSYLEPVLCGQRDEAAHPAYQNLFIRTEKLQRYGAEALRRPRQPEEKPVRLWHLLTSDTSLTVFHVQTDRTAFLGRGRSVYAPRAMEQSISALADGVGDMIEPCLSLRAQFILPAGGKAHFVFATLCPTRQDTAASFAERYDRPENALRCYEPALTQGLVTARYLDLNPEQQNRVSRLCGCLCYTGQPMQFRYAARNVLPLRELWSMGLSGDHPILLLECGDPKKLELARLLLKAHAYYHMSGFWLDLVLLCQQPAGYEHPLKTALSELVEASHSRELIGREGGVHLLERDSLTGEQCALLRAAARLVLLTDEDDLEEQLSALESTAKPRISYLCKPSSEWKNALPAGEELLFNNDYGGFSKTDGNYVITLPPGRQTPAPWCNPLCSDSFGTLAGESGLIFSYAGNSHQGRLTRWPNDSVAPRGEENFFLRDGTHKLIWSVTKAPLGYGLPARITHGPGETAYEINGYGIGCTLRCFTMEDAPLGVRVLHLKNENQTERILTFCHTCAFSLSGQESGVQLTTLTRGRGGLYAENPHMEGIACLCGVDPEPVLTTTMSAGAFSGLWGVSPAALCTAEPLPSDAGNVGVLCFTVQLKPGESTAITTVLGWGLSRTRLERALDTLRKDGASFHLHRVRQLWEQRLGGLRYDLPDTALALMLNRWLPYQVRASRLMMRAGFYQAGGAYGFRDQLQDMLSQLYTAPELVRGHLLLCAAHQYEEGDVQHWWHTPRYGVRTRISDDLLFLPFVTALYVQVTGDSGILTEQVSYLHSDPLLEEEKERLEIPEVSPIQEMLWQHCLRAIDHVAYGAHGLPLMQSGDWNDGMDRVGSDRGESVWLGMFLCEVLRRFLPLCDPVNARRLSDKRLHLLQMLDRHGWDGAWYLRAWYDSGDKLGSAGSTECRIDLLSQSWAVLSGISRERCNVAMDHVWRMLYERDIGLLKLFTPPFDGDEAPGYIAGYLPGIRENGGQYTHAVPWAIAAFHQLGQDDRAWELAGALLPIRHAATRQLANRYRVEPYVLAGDVYANPRQRGRGGWTWYTGSAAWYQFVLLEQLFGFQKIGNTLRFRPNLPKQWEGMRLSYRYGSATYHLHAVRDCPFPVADGVQLKDGQLILVDDGRIHEATFPVRG